MTISENLEQQFRAALREGDEAELVDDQQLVAGQLLLQAQQAFLVARLQELVHQGGRRGEPDRHPPLAGRSEEHTSELQSRQYLVCRLLLEKKQCSRALSK